ncbi:hypothetical protein [Nonomuraea aurantiaca]|uniref:hypothetical protein n=1 Tax=Nonomuraea aurantiaca TaxID=2878562 RepID=UPI001CDA0C46|nr:hypothetical protein [Nonomuraea aurantiaca]MCA2220857.1 hypothetical protein [Nonomuraea aurantiaca]
MPGQTWEAVVSLARAAESGAPPEEVIALRERVAWWIGARYHESGDPARALDLARAAVEESERLLGAEHAQTLTCRLTITSPPSRDPY